MTTTPTQPEPAKAKTVQPPPAPRAEPEMRRPSRVGRFFSRLMMLAVFCAVSFGGGYYVMDQEARLHRDVLMQEQSTAQDRIAALEEQIREMQLSRIQENSVEVDLTEVFAPIREAVSRLAEAQMTIVARQISTEIAERVDADVQNLNASAPLAAIAGAAVAALEPAIAAAPPSDATAEAPPPEPVAELTPGEPPGSPRRRARGRRARTGQRPGRAGRRRRRGAGRGRAAPRGGAVGAGTRRRAAGRGGGRGSLPEPRAAMADAPGRLARERPFAARHRDVGPGHRRAGATGPAPVRRVVAVLVDITHRAERRLTPSPGPVSFRPFPAVPF